MAKPWVAPCTQNRSNLKRQGLEMQGLWSRGIFQKVLRTPFTPQDTVFSTRFHYKIKRKGGEFDKCKVRLVVQGQHMKCEGAVGVGDYDDALARCLLLAVSALFLVFPPNLTCLLVMLIFLRPFYKVKKAPMNSGAGLTQIGLVTLICAAHTS